MNRFLKKNEVVADRQTGLTWTKDASLSGFPLTWSEAFEFVHGLNRSQFCGFSDWKLPNRRELFSLVSHAATNPSLPPEHPFINVFTGYYWTSTTCTRLPDQAWYIHLGGARVFKGMKYNSYMVWPVRSIDHHSTHVFQTGQRRCYDEKGKLIACRDTGQDGEFQRGLRCKRPRFIAETNYVYDKATGLSWLKDACVTNAMTDWTSAAEVVEKMNSQNRYGYHDWRVPRIAELESLTDMSRFSPALPEHHPFVNVQQFYWSATTSRYDVDYAWALYLEDGAVGVGYKALTEFYLWPVRGKIQGIK